MRIEYRATKHRMTVKDEVGQRLVAAGIAREVEEHPKATPEPEAKPKRTYRRRDMQPTPAHEANPDGGYITRDQTADE